MEDVSVSSQTIQKPDSGASPNTRLDIRCISPTKRPRRIRLEVIKSGHLVEVRRLLLYKIINNPPDKIYPSLKQIEVEKPDGSKVILLDQKERPTSPAIEEAKAIQRTKQRVSRARNRIKRRICANFKQARFLTLTFDNNNKFDINDPAVCYLHLANFWLRLRRKFRSFHYIAVVEFQKRGAVHYHILYDLPYIRKSKLTKIWGHGFISVKYFRNLLQGASYLSKYLFKQAKDKRFKGRRMYYTSKNMVKSKIFYNIPALGIRQKMINHKIKPSYEKEYYSEFCGTVIYEEYNSQGLDFPYRPERLE